ncbi:hypothetical protein FNV43_RR17497 [Rhamnella rubrinervis]|uniref:B-like cyclin n=1 Tax=Rhamnella rubrinervis TaxID=2594499 RepID=A0A8K0E9J1_9ROSA|nr:hypothetical protein FNV43_RR17497 [Rhamnella rubrinervis]
MADNPGTSTSESSDRSASLMECKESLASWSDDPDPPTTSELQRNIGIGIQEPSVNGIRSESWLNFPMLSDERVKEMVEKESEHLPKFDYLYRLENGELDMKARNKSFDWISKGNPAWAPALSALCCLLLAAKAEESKKLRVKDFQLIPCEYHFSAYTIRRVERIVVNKLGWRMLPITPCSYIDYFLSKINDDQCPSKSSISEAFELILRSIQGIQFLQCRPSEIAAAVALYVSGERQAASNINKAMSGFEQEVKARALNCLQMIKALESHSDPDDDDGDDEPESSDESLDIFC